MKKAFGVLAAFCLAAVLGASVVFISVSTPALAQEAPTERIKDLSVRVELLEDGVLRVTETIVYDFGAGERHGIFRDIPLKYDGGRGAISVRSIRVTGADGGSEPFTTSKDGGYLRIKIGDPDVLVSGVRTYVIEYAADGAVQWGGTVDRIIWNATGNEWQVPIESAAAALVLPPSASGVVADAACYQGLYGSTETCSASGMAFAASRALAPGEGLTLSLTLPKGVLTPPSLAERTWAFARSHWSLLLPLFVFIFFFNRWWRLGRDPKGRGTIIPQYEPPAGLSPLETGLLVSGYRAHPGYISAEIISLAVQGYLKIVPVGEGGGKPKDYTLEKLKDPAGQEPEFDRKLMESLFADGPAVSLSSLKNKFAAKAKKVLDAGFKSLIAKGYYDKDPRKALMANLIGQWPLGAVVVLGFLGFGRLPWGGASLTLAAVITIAFALFMPRVTKKGALEKEHIAGFRDYLDIAEKDRLNFHNAPEKTPELFERFLPYALALGVVDAWAKEFQDIYTEPPQWYGGHPSGTFLAAGLAHDLRNFGGFAGQAMASSASSGGGSGGGFSGGGAGGGGGGSW